MKNKIEDFYVTQFAERGFTPAPNNLDYCEVGTTWQLNDNIGTGTFWIYNRQNRCVELFEGGNHGQSQVNTIEGSVEDPALAELLGTYYHDRLAEEINLLDLAGEELDQERVLRGRLTPVFFGSAMTNFGVETFLNAFIQMAPCPQPQLAGEEIIDPAETPFSGFVFKIQANMNPAHRDRLAFLRICSGKYQREAEVFHVQGNKKMRLSQPQQLMAAEREIVEEAYAGDIIGVFDPGIFSIGDTITTPGKKFRFAGIPTFPPEHFSRVSPKDTMKRKQFVKGTEQIAQEGAIQIFKTPYSGMEEVIVGVVGTLQFDVLEYRLKNEYNVDIRMEGLPYQYIRWIENEDLDPKTLNLTSDTKRIQDVRGRYLLLFTNSWNINWAEEHNPDLVLSEFGRN